MISLYSGTPGSGKSLHCARTIINWSRFGHPVVGNFPVDLSRYKRAAYTYCPNDELTPKFLMEHSRNLVGDHPKEGSLLLVIDECQLLFNAREWNGAGRAKWTSFFMLHRKFGYDIILIAQFDRMVDRQIRSLIEYEYIHRKMSNFGWQGKLLSLAFGGKTFIAVKRWYPLRERLGSEIFHARKYMYSIYDTYAIFDESPNQEQTPAETSPEPESSPEAAAPVSWCQRLAQFWATAISKLGKKGKFSRGAVRDERGWKISPKDSSEPQAVSDGVETSFGQSD